MNAWYDKKREIINDHFSRSVSELRSGLNKSYDQRKAELEYAFAEAGVSGKAPSPTAEESRARSQQALEIARMELSGSNEKEDTAYHEAGHAVAALVLSQTT